MKKAPRTPREILKDRSQKKTFSFSLIKTNVEKIAQLAAVEGVPISSVIDEAISYYLQYLEDTKSN
jgi:predicted DNA-binding protein